VKKIRRRRRKRKEQKKKKKKKKRIPNKSKLPCGQQVFLEEKRHLLIAIPSTI
jgi:hypothetical protein